VASILGFSKGGQMKYLRALEGLTPAFIVSLVIAVMQVISNFRRIGLGASESLSPLDYLFSALLYFPFIEFLIFLIIAIRTRITASKMGELQLQLPVVFPSGKAFRQKSRKLLGFEIFIGLLSIPFTYFLLKFLEKLAASQTPWQQLSEITLWSTSVLVFLTYMMLLLNWSFGDSEIRKSGIITSYSSYKWEQIFDYELLTSGQSYLEVLGTKYKVPKGFNALKIRYLRPQTWVQKYELLALVRESPIFFLEKDKAEIEQIFSSNLPELSQEYRSNTLRFPVSGWEGFLENTSTVINPTGIFQISLAIDLQRITACQWEDLQTKNIWVRRLISLNLRKNYYILRVRWTDHQRLKWTEINVPAALVTQVQTQLLKFLPEHVQMNQPSGSVR
jgi:hypothetical protein